MPSIKYKIELIDIVIKRTSPTRTILRANILLSSDRTSEKCMTVSKIANVYHTSHTTVQTVRSLYCEKGLEATLNRKKHETPLIPAKVTGDVEARIIALVCGEPPQGCSNLTLRLLYLKILILALPTREGKQVQAVNGLQLYCTCIKTRIIKTLCY